MGSTDSSVSGSGDQRPGRSGPHRRATTGWGRVPRIESGAAVLPKPPASDYSRYVGRVGALAVALGIGAAIAAMPGAAFADTGSEGSEGSTGSSSSDSSGSGVLSDALGEHGGVVARHVG